MEKGVHTEVIILKCMYIEGTTKDEIMAEMIEMIDRAGMLFDKEEYKESLYRREKEGSTGIGFGIAIPHGKSTAVRQTCVAFGVKRNGVDWDSLDGEKAKLIFMIAVPEEHAGNEHLKILQLLSRKLISDTTYRIYYYDRVDEHGKKRELHLAKRSMSSPSRM
ncbi:PTS system mannose-specific EIIBCA component [Anoxybacillus sp. BCO1]|nr:PTS system mannose-specific EIIBCA component [Anoxybacillus sp. BCO1]